MTSKSLRIGPKIKALVATNCVLRPPVARLSPAQVAQLVALARRRPTVGVEASPARAINTLAEGAKAEIAVPVLQAILANNQLTMTERAAAARGLGHIATPEAERALLRHVRSLDPRVQQHVLSALGSFAGPAAGRTLGKLTAPEDIAAYRQLVFAAALVAHRHGLNGPFLAETLFVERVRSRLKRASPLKARTRSAQVSKTALGRFRGRDYGITFTDRVHSIDCGPLRWELLLNEHLGRSASGLAKLLERPWIAGVLALWLPAKEALHSRYVILTRPIGKSIRIDIVRADGEVVYAGNAARTDTGVEFRLSDVVRPGTAPLNLVGLLTSGGMKIVSAVSSATRVNTREVLPVDLA
jgi:hypothetical protein